MYSRILVPLDGSKTAEAALAHAEGLAKSSQGTIHLLWIFRRSIHGGNPTGFALDSDRSPRLTLEMVRQMEEAQLETAEEYLEHISIRLNNSSIDVQTEIEEGSVSDHIIDYAKKNAVDIIVMASHGHGGLRRMILGSTTERVIRACEVPVLVVPA